MKCVCGYEYEKNWNGKEFEVIKGDEEFIQIDCHTTVKRNMEDRKVDLYACPKCHTVKIEPWYF